MHFHNCLLLLLFTLKWIFSATLIRVRYLPIKGLPYPCAHFTFIYRINEQSLAVYHDLRRFTSFLAPLQRSRAESNGKDLHSRHIYDIPQ